MKRNILVASLALVAACASADGQTQPSGSGLSIQVLNGMSDDTGYATVSLPVNASEGFPLIQVLAQDGNSNTWHPIADADGDSDGPAWYLEAPTSGPLVLKMREIGSAGSVAGPVAYRILLLR